MEDRSEYQVGKIKIRPFTLAKAVLHIRFGKLPDKQLIDYVVWEWTGYPCFFIGPNPNETYEMQLWASMIGPHPLEDIK